MSNLAIEVHLGVSTEALSDDPDLLKAYPEFEWSNVYATRSGSGEQLSYLGHGVDGHLGAIGTLRSSYSDAAELVGTLVPRASVTDGSRLEIEAIEENDFRNTTMIERFRRDTVAVCAQLMLPVAAPKYEKHIRVEAQDRHPAILHKQIARTLLGRPYFELTTFSAEHEKAIVTVTGNQPEAVQFSAEFVASELEFYGEDVTVGSLENVITCWRPKEIQ